MNVTIVFIIINVLWFYSFAGSNLHRNRGYALVEMDRLTDTVFKRMFRVDRPTFNELLDLISPIMIERDVQKAINSLGTPIQPKTRLAVTLRWLAGGSRIDLCFAWGIGYYTFYSERGVLWPAIEAIDEVFHIGLPIDDVEKLEKLSQGFHAQSNAYLMDLLW